MPEGSDGTRHLPRLDTGGFVLPRYASTHEILAHPRFLLARDHYIATSVSAYRTDRVMRHLMHDIARHVLFNIILGRHAAMQVDEPETWPTVGRLRQLFLAFDMASPRSFDEMLARMQMVRLITIEPAPDDRRRKLVIPTETMIAEDLAWLAQHMSPLAVLFPERADYRPALNHDRVYQQSLRILSSQNLGVARDVLAPGDPIFSLFRRQSAHAIVYIYMLDALGRADGIASVRFEVAAEQLSTSRTHVRNLFRALETLELVRLHGRGGHGVEIMPGLWRWIEQFLAASMSGHDMIWQATRQIVGARPQAA